MLENRFVFIMPCFNAEETIVQSLLSVISQHYQNWKILIRDDMSKETFQSDDAKFQKS